MYQHHAVFVISFIVHVLAQFHSLKELIIPIVKIIFGTMAVYTAHFGVECLATMIRNALCGEFPGVSSNC